MFNVFNNNYNVKIAFEIFDQFHVFQQLNYLHFFFNVKKQNYVFDFNNKNNHEFLFAIFLSD